MSDYKGQKKPNLPKQKGKVLPVDVKTYFKNGKRVKGYSRRKAGEGNLSQDEKKKGKG